MEICYGHPKATNEVMMAQPPLVTQLYIFFYCSEIKTLYGFKKASASIHQLDLKYKFHPPKTVRLADFHSPEKWDQEQKVTETTTDQNSKTIP